MRSSVPGGAGPPNLKGLTMNRIIASAALALAAISGAASAHTGLAGDITIETDRFVSSRDPAETRAELVAFKKSGVNPWSRSYNPLLYFKSLRERMDVSAEFIEHRDEVAALNGEDSGSMYLAESRAATAAGVRTAQAAE